jgi:hypothetical protein
MSEFVTWQRFEAVFSGIEDERQESVALLAACEPESLRIYVIVVE